MSSYEESQRRICDAEAALLEGEHGRARALYLEAAKLQRTFVDEQPSERVRTRSVFGLSAAALFYKAGELDEAERLARALLAAPWVEPASAMKLRALLEQINGDRATAPPGVVRQRLQMFGVTSLRPARRPLFRDARP